MTDPDFALVTQALSKRYRRKWGLQDCSLSLPTGKIAALVGPNGSGKSTLLRMAAGLSRPTSGSVTVFGHDAGDQDPEVLRRTAYLDQARPLYRTWRVGEILRFGEQMNDGFDSELGRRHLEELGIDLRSRVRNLSIGQQAQVSLALCLGKQADLLLLDEPAAALDPLARSQLMSLLLATVAERQTTVLLSSHAIADLANVCDYIVILSASRVQLAGDLDEVVDGHLLLTGPRRDPQTALPPGLELIHATETSRQSTWLVRGQGAALVDGWSVTDPTLEEVVLGYLKAPLGAGGPLSVTADEAGVMEVVR